MSATANKDHYGPGTTVDKSFAPVPEECKRILHELVSRTPGFTTDTTLIDGVSFHGSDLPCIPGPLKSQALTAVLHAMAGIVGHEILQLRGISTDKKTIISTDQAGVYLGTPAVSSIDGVDGPKVLENKNIPHSDLGCYGTPVKLRSQAIYETKTPGVWYQLHGSTNPDPVLKAIGVDPDSKTSSGSEAYKHITDHMVKYSARELEMMMVEGGLAGSIVHSPEAWLKTMMGATLARHPLLNYNKCGETADLAPVVLPPPHANDKRPLQGIKVVELTRIIAGPACGAALASMGAEVVRVQTKRQVDFTPAQITSLMAGKTNYELDIEKSEDHKTLLDLISTADVVLQGYRVGSLERHGFGLNACLEIANRRGKGIVYLDENCYGPDGYYAERPGWQQVADAAAGSSYVMGKAYGNSDGHGVLPSLPISDMSTGIVAAVDVLLMLRDRTKFGGSYHATASLVAYNMVTLQSWVGLYGREVLQQIQDKYRFAPMTSDLHVIELYDMVFDAWKKAGEGGGSLISNEDLYTHFKNSVYGKDLRILAPVVKYRSEETTPRWNKPPMPFSYLQGAKWE